MLSCNTVTKHNTNTSRKHKPSKNESIYYQSSKSRLFCTPISTYEGFHRTHQFNDTARTHLYSIDGYISCIDCRSCLAERMV